MENSVSLRMCRQYLGQKAKITIDQPLGTWYKNAWYSVNYGFIPDTTAPDGEELDAYYLSSDQPLETAEGICIAIIHRLDDDDDKLILVSEQDKNITDEEIDAKVNFREKFFKHIIVR
jgi:inorganic pyrophosphatase